MMLPYSLVIFANFSIYHPLSILWTSLFTLFYPLEILLHTLGYGDLLDVPLRELMHLGEGSVSIEMSSYFLVPQVLLSLLALYKKEFLALLVTYTLSIFIYAIYNVA